MTKKESYTKRQVFIMSNLGLFYLIIIAFFAVPLLGAFVVVLIKGVADLRHAIVLGGALLLLIAMYAFIRFLRKWFRKIREDSFMANQEIKEKMSHGQPVQVSVFNGLISFTYGGHRYSEPVLPHQSPMEKSALLPLPEKTPDLVSRLKELSSLKDQGIVTEDEFQIIKQRLIKADSSTE